jgi:lipoyl(octanoyl) transferase
MKVVSLEPWNQVSYNDALRRQAELSRLGEWGWILFCCPPTITSGRRARASDVLVSKEKAKELGIELLEVDRGGQVTYHGPGQIIGFPFGTLQRHIGDPRGVKEFVAQLQGRLRSFVEEESEGRLKATCVANSAGAGVWVSGRKIAALGLAFSREGISHGFALNVEPMLSGFEWIHPCGEPGARPASLLEKPATEEAFIMIRERLGRKLLGASA